MIPPNEFLAAVQIPYKPGATLEVESLNLRGRVIEQVSYSDYVALWAWHGCPEEGISLFPRYYYRCEKLGPIRPEISSADPVASTRDAGESAADAL